MTDEEMKELQEFAKKIIETTVVVAEERLSKTLGSRIAEQVKPLNESAIDVLQADLKEASTLLSAINSSFMGWWVLKRTKKKLIKGIPNGKRQKGQVR